MSRDVVSNIFLPDDEAPQSDLPDRLRSIREFVADPTARDCRLFTEQMELWRTKGLYKHFAPTWEAFCADNFTQPIEWIDHIIQGVKILDGEGCCTKKLEIEAMTEDEIQAQIQEMNAELERRKRERFLEDYQHLKKRWGEELERFILNAYEELQCEKGQTQESLKEERRKAEVEAWHKTAQIGTKKRFKSTGGYANSTPRGFFGEDKPQKQNPEPEVAIQGSPGHPATTFDGKFLEDLFGPPDDPVPDDETMDFQEVTRSNLEAIREQVKAEFEADCLEVKSKPKKPMEMKYPDMGTEEEVIERVKADYLEKKSQQKSQQRVMKYPETRDIDEVIEQYKFKG